MTVPKALRRVVAERAGGCCEYCLLDEPDSYTPHQVDHIVSQKHGGTSDSQNFAWACTRCNSWKGSDASAIAFRTSCPETGEAVPLFHPRRHGSEEHFELRGYRIEPLTPIGAATVRLLRLNADQRIAERRILDPRS